MCLSKAKQIHLKDDMTVYKIVKIYKDDENEIYPLFGQGVYHFNVIETAECDENKNKPIKELGGINVRYNINDDGISIYDGVFHSLTNSDDCYRYFNKTGLCQMLDCIEIIECIIPKNSVVFEGKFEFFGDDGMTSFKSYASNKIIYKQIIE